MRDNQIYILIALILTLFVGCSQTQKIKGISERELIFAKSDQAFDLNRMAYAYYVDGMFFEMENELMLANNRYRDALKYYGNSDVIRLAYARTFLGMGDVSGSLEQVRQVENKNAEAWMLLANCHESMGHTDSIAGAYREAIKLDSLNVEAYYRLGMYYQQVDNLDSAIWAYGKLANLAPANRVYNRLGNLQIQAGHYEDAEKSFEQSLAIDSSGQNILPLINIAIIRENRGELETAGELLRQAVELAPDDIELSRRLLDFYQRNNDLNRAIEAARHIAELTPNDNILTRQLALFYFESNDIITADSIFQYLIESGDSSTLNFYYSGRVALYNKDYFRAEDLFKYITKTEDSIVDGWLNLGLAYRYTDNFEQELATYKSGLKAVPAASDSVNLYFSSGVACELNDRFDQSIENFEKLIELDSGHSQALNYLGYMMADKGVRLNEARSLIERALQIVPDNGAYLDSYGWVLYRLGELDQAREALFLAYEYVSDDPIILEHIGDVLSALGDKGQAVEYYKMALELDPDNNIILEKISE